MRDWTLAIFVSIAMVCAAFFCVGFYQDSQVEETKIEHVVKSGETLNGIALKYYRQNKKDYISQRDYAMMVRVANNDKHNLDRKLQIGDRVVVPIYKDKQ